MTNRVRIQLLEPVQGYLDVVEGTAFPLNFSIADIRDISKRTGSFSKTVQLVGNDNNNQLLGLLFDVNLTQGTYNVNTLQKCLIEQNGIIILDNMYLQLTAVNKVQLANNNDIEVTYEAQVRDSTSDFFSKINQLELTDIDFSVFDHELSVSNILDSYDNTYVDGYKYLLPWKDKAAESSDVYNLNELSPAIYLRQYLDKIVFNAGYSYEFDQADDFNIQSNKLIIPYNGDGAKPIDDNRLWVRAYSSLVPYTYQNADTLGGLTPVICDQETLDTQNIYDPVTGEYTVNYPVFAPSSIRYETTVKHTLTITNNNLFQVIASGGDELGIEYSVRTVVTDSNQTYPAEGQGFKWRLPQGLVLNPGQVYTITTDFVETIISDTTRISPVDNLSLGFYAMRVFNLANQSWKRATGEESSVLLDLSVSEIDIIVKPNLDSFVVGSTLTMNSFVPKKIKQSEFIKSFAQMYNLYIDVDRNNPQKLIFKTRDEYYDSGEIVDWKDKICKDRPQIINFLPELSSKKLILSYKQDSDFSNSNYQKLTNEVYGELSYIFENQYVKNVERKELIFSPTPNAYTRFGANVPMLNGKNPKCNIRILLDNGELSCNNYSIIYDLETATYDDQLGDTVTYVVPVTQTVDTYPYLSHFSNNPQLPNFDINYGICEYYFYALNQLTNNNLYNFHWRRTLGQINTGKMLTAEFDLNETDINKLRLNSTVYCLNSYWYINKIIDYDANSTDVTTVELLSIETEVIPALETAGVSESNLLGDVFIGTDGSTLLENTGRIEQINFDKSNGATEINGNNNVVNANTSGYILGNNNNVSTDGSNIVYGDFNNINSQSTVLGSFNTISADFTNVFVFTNNYTVTTSNTIVVPENLVLNGPDPSINGVLFSDITAAATGWPGVLTIDATSGPTNPVLSDGSQIGGGEDPVTAATVNILSLGDSVALDFTWYLGDRDANTGVVFFNAIDLIMANGSGSTFLRGSVGVSTEIIGIGDHSIYLADNTGGAVSTADNDKPAIFVGARNSAIGQNAVNCGIFATDTSSIPGSTVNSAILGGNTNILSGDNSAVLAGDNNNVAGDNSVIIGGTNSTAAADRSFIAASNGGSISTASTGSAIIAGGVGSTITNTSLNSIIFIGPGANIDNSNGCIVFGPNTIRNSSVNTAVIGGSVNVSDGTSNSAIVASNGLDNTNDSYDRTLYNQDNYHDAYHTVTTANNTITNLYTFTPSNGVYHIEWDITAFEAATGDALGAKAFHTFKVIAGAVTSVSTTSLDRKSNFPAGVTVTIDTDGTLIRARVTGRTGSTIVWRGHLKIVK